MRRTALVLLVLLALYAAAGFLLAPWLAQRYLPGLLGQRLGAAVSVGEFRVNPFLLTAQARDVTISSGDAAPIVRAKQLLVDASPLGLLRSPRTLERVSASGLAVRLDLREGGTPDIRDLARHWADSQVDAKPARTAWTLRQLDLDEAALHLTAARDGRDVQAAIAPITLHASDLSTSPGEGRGSYELTAQLPAQGKLQSSGSVQLQPDPSGQGQVTASGVHAGALLPFVQDLLPLARAEAQASLSASYAWHRGSLSLADVTIDADGVDVRSTAPQASLQAQHVAASGGVVQVANRTVHFDELRIAQGRARADLLPPVESPVRASPPAGAPANPSDRDAGWTVQAGRVLVDGLDLALAAAGKKTQTQLSLDLAGLHAQGGLRAVIGPSPLRLVATQVQAQWGRTTLRLAESPLQALSLGSGTIEGGAFDLARRQVRAAAVRLADGSVSLVDPQPSSPPHRDTAGDAAARPWHLQVDQLQLSAVGGQYVQRRAKDQPPLLRLGSADATLRLDATLGGPQATVQASQIEATLRDATLAGERRGEPALRLASAHVGGGHVDTAKRQAHAADLALAGAVRVVRGADGQLALAAPVAAPARGTQRRAASPAWCYSIAKLRLHPLQVHLRDHMTQPALALDGELQGTARDIASRGPGTFDAQLRLAQGGMVKGQGSVDLGAGRVDAHLQGHGVALRPLQPLLRRFADLSLKSGTLSASLHVQAGGDVGPLLAQGQVGVANLLLQESGSDAHFLSWQQLDVDDALLDLGAMRLTTGQVRVRQPSLKVVVTEQREVNLTQVLHARGPTKEPAAPEDATAGGAQGLQVLVGRVRLEGGEVDFTDNSLVLPFSTQVRNVEGSIVDISNLPSRRASVQAEGDIAPYGSARVDGSFLPRAPGEFTRLDVQFDNVRVPPLSPYTATFAGRKVESGKLWLDLGYHVEDGQLQGSNDIRLSDFRLGDRVDAPNALDVPLDLVVGLLKDDSGTIQLSVPVTGEVGDPHFSLASAIGQAVGNVLKRAVTAPFRLLANLFGHGSQTLDAVEFPVGSAELRPQEAEKLQALSRALQARPSLQLAVTGRYDAESDAAALREQKARRALARALGREAGPQEDPGPFSFDDPATQAALERLLRATAGDEAVRELRQRFDGRAGDGQWDLYEAMLSRLAAAQPLADSETRVLAVERARAIVGFLRGRGVAAARLRSGGLANAQAGDDGEIASRLAIMGAGP